MFLELAFDRKTEVSLFDSNYGLFDEKRFLEADKKLVFKIFESSAITKFLSIFDGYKKSNAVNEQQKGFRYNYYIKQTQVDYSRAVEKLNYTIDEINSFEIIKINTNLKISPNSQFEVTKKLNELHLIFELSLNQQEVRANEKIHQKFWILNNLIHSLENIETVSPQRSWYMVTNLHSHVNTDWFSRPEQLLAAPLEASDFKNFEWPKEKILYLDYATTGKDLMDCFYSNDVELVKSGLVKQQSLIKAGFLFEMNSGRTSISNVETLKQYKQWLSQNNIERFLNLNDPQYNAGRLKIGELVEFENKTWDVFWDYNYSLAGIKITS